MTTCQNVPSVSFGRWCAALALLTMGCGATIRPADDAAVQSDVVGADVVGADVVGTDVVGADVVGTDVVGTDVVGTDVVRADVVNTDVVGTDVVNADVVGTDVVNADVVGGCAPARPAPAPQSSTGCRAERMMVDAISLCGNGMRCPVSSMVSLRCDDRTGYGPWVTADGAGASVLFVTNIGNFRSRIFSIPESGAPGAVDLRGVGVASTVLRNDPAGGLHLVHGEAPGVSDLARGPAGWSSTEIAPAPPSGGLFPTDARFTSDAAYVAWFNFSDHSATIATRRAGCWSTRPILDTVITDVALSLDGAGAPWTAYYGSEQGTVVLRTLSPDGMTHELWRASGSDTTLNHRAYPRIVAGGINGRGRWPVAIVRDSSGTHLRLRADDASAWSRLTLPNSTAGTVTSDCPTGGPPGPGGDPCNGLTSCSQRSTGSADLYSLARTASGRLFALWTQHDTVVDHTLSGGGCTGGGGGVDAGGPPRCVCTSTPTGSRGELTLWYGEVSATGVAAPQRLRFNTGGPVAPYFDAAARGEHLLVVLPMNSPTGLELRYLDLDVGAR